jgi:oligopeptide transport system ATP-binding protein
MDTQKRKILEIRNLQVSFCTTTGTVRAIRGVDIDLCEGQTLAIVGESGSGKSVTMKSVMGILDKNSSVDGGTVTYT